MAKIGIFFSSETGRTQLVAQYIAKSLGGAAASPVNIENATLSDFLAHDALILGSPTHGSGQPHGPAFGLCPPTWQAFLAQLAGADLSGKVVAIYGVGDQKKYPGAFVNAIAVIQDALLAGGARVVGRWPTTGYDFTASQAVDGGQFVGLALDQTNQPGLTGQRVESWLAQVRSELLP
ncbi:flavodoxin [Candidatus Accumulibacter sp. ACC003]|uniref:flavodoxin n=1 Tax=Candidatus Accumulibacter sp. ACC003 TaxID=2823334 RepID=UPI0025BB0DAA|nr:flavodoxin [Candidatus Accumulibacter sp. ACC003]